MGVREIERRCCLAALAYVVSVIANPLTGLSIELLRQRTSVKWGTHPTGVLPLWVAEMDVRLAPSIHAVLSRAPGRRRFGMATVLP